MTLISNLEVYRAIAEEAHAAMKENLAAAISPKPGGEPGNVIRYDRDHRSFKNAMITIAFVGMYMDARLYIELLKKLGVEQARKVDRDEHEKRLQALDVSDTDLFAKVRTFREARKELVHEKAVDVTDLTIQNIHVAQDCADDAIALLRDLRRVFGAA